MTARAPERPPTGLSRSAERAGTVPRPGGRLREWLAAISVAVLALLLRMRHLGTPDEFAFDETYYAKHGWSLVHHGYVREFVDNADKLILAGDTSGLWLDEPTMIVHPEVGKWLIGLSELAFGLDPTGWRIPSLVAGSLLVLVMVRLVRRLTGSTLWGCVAGLLLALDGLHFVLSRLALLDIFVALFTLCAVHCVIADRQWLRARLAGLTPGQVTGRGWGPVRGLLWRPWLLAGGVCFGLAVGTKWVALYVLAGFGVLAWAWSAGARRALGVRWAVAKSTLVDGVPAFCYLVLVALVVYLASWTGWLVNAEEYEQSLSNSQYATYDGGQAWPTRDEPDASGFGEVAQSLRSLAHYHHDMYIFHTRFLDDSDHTYQSSPLGWLLVNKGVGVNAETDIQPGDQGCGAPADSDCIRQVLLIGTPALWWGSCLALLASVALWVGQRDWRFGVPVVGAAVTWLPWLANDDRPIFFFYAIMSLPFLVIASTLVMGKMVGPGRAPTSRRTTGVVVAGSFFLLVVVNFAWFWPIWTNELLTNREWVDRIWFTRWI